MRFDPVYVVYFKTNVKRIADYPNLVNFVRAVTSQRRRRCAARSFGQAHQDALLHAVEERETPGAHIPASIEARPRGGAWPRSGRRFTSREAC